MTIVLDVGRSTMLLPAPLAALTIISTSGWGRFGLSAGMANSVEVAAILGTGENRSQALSECRGADEVVAIDGRVASRRLVRNCGGPTGKPFPGDAMVRRRATLNRALQSNSFSAGDL
jgi:hypothetical protein